ncbi:MAG: MATE family efflux transporter [Spirochaetales bacterium]|nr:MATE family efflux transporter [Spirochaetales bacterium]
MLTNREFRKHLIVLSLPMMLQQLLTTTLSFLDTLMIGQLGATSISAVAIANQMNVLLFYCVFGVSSGASVFLARYYGGGKEDSMEKVMGLGLTCCLLFSLLWFLGSFLFPESIMHIFSKDEEVVRQGCSYLRIIAPSYFLYALTYIFSTGFRSVGRTSIPLYASLVALTLNAVGNYLLIFGIGPFPRLGVRGAAIATLLSRLVEVSIIVLLSYLLRMPYRIRRLGKAFVWSCSFFLEYLRVCLPILLNEIFFVLGISIFKIAYSRLGTEAFAAINIAEAIENVFFITSLGISHATTVLISQRIGAGEESQAQRYADQTVRLDFIMSLIQGLLIAATAPLLVQLFNISPELKRETMLALFVIALYQPAISVGMLYFVGIFRAGGDTNFSFIGETACVFLVGIPLAFITTALGLPIYIVLSFVHLNAVAKTIVGAVHLRSRRWMKAIDS